MEDPNSNPIDVYNVCMYEFTRMGIHFPPYSFFQQAHPHYVGIVLRRLWRQLDTPTVEH